MPEQGLEGLGMGQVGSRDRACQVEEMDRPVQGRTGACAGASRAVQGGCQECAESLVFWAVQRARDWGAAGAGRGWQQVGCH